MTEAKMVQLLTNLAQPDVIIRGWKRDYRLTGGLRERFTDEILKCLSCTYTGDDGETAFMGQSMSQVEDQIRHGGTNLIFPSDRVFRENLMNELGFRVVRARGERWYKGGKRGWGVTCDCVTV